MPQAIQARLDELGEQVDRDTTVTLFRNWDGFVCGIVDPGDPRFEILIFTEDGRVGYGGVNQPAYYDSGQGLDGWGKRDLSP